MKTSAFETALAPDGAPIVGGYASGPGINPVKLADEVFKGHVPGVWLTCYMLRRFGWPNCPSDDHKDLCSWTLTTPESGLFVEVSPSLSSQANLHFGVRFDERVRKELERDPGRESFSDRKEAAIQKWWNKVGMNLYALGTGKAVGDRDELVHIYTTERDGMVTGLWRRRRAGMRKTPLPKGDRGVIWWLGEFIKEEHAEVRVPLMNKRERAATTTRAHLRFRAAYRATLRDLLRPTSLRSYSFSPLGDTQRSETASALSAKLKPTEVFEGAGMTPKAWFARPANLLIHHPTGDAL